MVLEVHDADNRGAVRGAKHPVRSTGREKSPARVKMRDKGNEVARHQGNRIQKNGNGKNACENWGTNGFNSQDRGRPIECLPAGEIVKNSRKGKKRRKNHGGRNPGLYWCQIKMRHEGHLERRGGRK